MLRTLARLPATAALLLYSAAIPLALSSDDPQGDQASTSAALEAKVEKATPPEKTNTSVSKSDKQATAAVAGTKESLKDTSDWVCRKETPTGSHRRIEVCRRAADIEASSDEVGQVMNRQQHYGNPSVTPEG